MHSISTIGASVAPSTPETLRRSRIEASGVPASLAATLLDLAFAVPKRDDLVTLASVTASRVAGSSNLGALARG